jgi:hypothetical protein
LDQMVNDLAVNQLLKNLWLPRGKLV